MLMFNGSKPSDRRVYAREEVHLVAEATRMANTVSAHRHPALRLAVHDFSQGGLSAITDTPLEPGEQVAMFFPSHRGQPVYDLLGQVVRCEPKSHGYRVALQFNSLAA